MMKRLGFFWLGVAVLWLAAPGMNLVQPTVLQRPASAAAEEKPVACYTFEEGTGDVLHDVSGNENHGRIVDAKWVPLGKKWALEFDGRNSYVDCGGSGTLDPLEAFTLEAWVYIEPVNSIYYMRSIVGDMVGGPSEVRLVSSCAGQLPQRRWVHLAQVFDGNNGNARLYLDGQLQTLQFASGSHAVSMTAKGSFLIGEATPAEQSPFPYLANRSRFQGKVAEVRLYNRALTPQEILVDVRSTNVTGCPIPSPLALPGLGLIKVQIDAARLGVPLKDITVTASVCVGSLSGAPPLATATVKEFDDRGRAIVDIPVTDLPKGDYVIRAAAKDFTGKPVGVTGEEIFSWPGSARFPTGPDGARKLNNLVTELLNVKGPDVSGREFGFTNPRNGFVFFSNRGAKEVTLTPEGDQPTLLILSQDFGPTYETIRFLPKGKYTLYIARVDNLVVRSVAETIYDCSPSTPYIPQFGPYKGSFEERYVFPHVTTITTWNPDHPPLAVWKAKGRRILCNTGTSYQPKEGQSKVDAIYEKLVSDPGFTHPISDGLTIDEFAATTPETPLWKEAIDRALSEPRFKGKVVHCFSYALSDFVGGYAPEPTHPGRDLVSVLRKHDSAVLWECYAKDRRSEFNGLWWHNDKILGEFLAARQADPDLADTLIVTPYAYVAGVQPWMVQTLPSADWRVVLDRQFQLLATHPEYAGLHGIMTYRSDYADEEMVRFGARLFRHYAIEGNTARFCNDPYELLHIRNPEFEEQGKDWTLKPAEQDSIRFDIFHQLGIYQGRYDLVAEGDTGLVTRRCANAPNTFSQKIKGLEPGRLYTFRMFTMDRTDPARPGRHTINIRFDNATLITKKSFVHVADVATWMRSWRKPWYSNYHYRVFRATENTATLTISDWASEKEPGGPIDQEFMYNFIKVQPYWPADQEPTQAVEEKPVACYTFEEGNGDVLTDMGGRGNQGRIVGAKWVPLGKKWALTFDGRDDYVDCGNDSSFNLTDTFTIETWVKFDSVAGFQSIVAKGKVSSIEIHYDLSQSGGKAYGRIADGSVINETLGTTALTTGIWYHIAFVSDNTGLCLYVNGERDSASVVPKTSRLTANTENLYLGRWNGTAHPLHGTIGGVVIYNRALTEGEIKEHYEMGSR